MNTLTAVLVSLYSSLSHPLNLTTYPIRECYSPTGWWQLVNGFHFLKRSVITITTFHSLPVTLFDTALKLIKNDPQNWPTFIWSFTDQFINYPLSPSNSHQPCLDSSHLRVGRYPKAGAGSYYLLGARGVPARHLAARWKAVLPLLKITAAASDICRRGREAWGEPAGMLFYLYYKFLFWKHLNV